MLLTFRAKLRKLKLDWIEARSLWLGRIQYEGNFARIGTQHWVGVGEVMRAEAREAAETRMDEISHEVEDITGVLPEFIIREGVARDEILSQIDKDREIGVLVLAAGDNKDGPGPLVSALAG